MKRIFRVFWVCRAHVLRGPAAVWIRLFYGPTPSAPFGPTSPALAVEAEYRNGSASLTDVGEVAAKRSEGVWKRRQ